MTFWIIVITTMALSLWAAALTYVAAFVTSLAYLLWHLLPLLAGGRERE